MQRPRYDDFRIECMRWLSIILLGVMFTAPLFAAPPPRVSEGPNLQIRITVNGHSVTATLTDSPTTRDFLTLLPLTLTLEDYASTEKIANLSRKLSREDAPAGFDPSVGDITYYAPWGNLALFYRDYGYAKGLIKLGSLDEGMEVFNVPGSVTVTIESWTKQR